MENLRDNRYASKIYEVNFLVRVGQSFEKQAFCKEREK